MSHGLFTQLSSVGVRPRTAGSGVGRKNYWASQKTHEIGCTVSTETLRVVPVFYPGDVLYRYFSDSDANDSHVVFSGRQVCVFEHEGGNRENAR